MGGWLSGPGWKGPCVGSDWVAECAGPQPVTKTPWVGPKGSTQRGVSSTDFGKSNRHFGLILQHRLDSGRFSCLVWVRVVWSVRDRPLEPRRHTQLGIKRLGWSSLFGSSICRGALPPVDTSQFDHDFSIAYFTRPQPLLNHNALQGLRAPVLVDFFLYVQVYRGSNTK